MRVILLARLLDIPHLQRNAFRQGEWDSCGRGASEQAELAVHYASQSEGLMAVPRFGR